MQEIAILASRALTTQRQFTAIADNVANVNTSGFRKLSMDFKEVLAQKNRPDAMPASYVADRGITIDQTDGALQKTGNPLDVAVTGPGFFAIQVNGTTQYTRKGQFVINSASVLTTPEGYPVLDNSGAQIQFPDNVKNISIAPDGTISTEEGQLVPIGVFQFDDAGLKTLQRTGNASFLPANGVAPLAADTPSVKQGFLEGSNVNAVQEMVDMDTVSRAYQSSINLLSSLNELESKAISTLGKVQ